MTTSHKPPELQRVFTQKCLSNFNFLTTLGFELAGIEVERHGAEVTFKNQTTGIKISFDIRENDIFVYLIRLISGEIPAYIDAPSRWFYLDNVVKLRSPSMRLPRKEVGDWLTPGDINHILTAYAAALQKYAEDILRGDFSAFIELNRRIDRPSSSMLLDEVQLIRNNEELRKQQQRLLAQIPEYYDTYFSELRTQLQRPELFSEAIPNFLKGYKRVISIGGGDGLVVAHFPIELEITFSAKDGGSTLLRLPSVLDAKEDHYEFLQRPELPVRDLVNLVSGEEDVGIEIPAEGMFWGVRGFDAPQQKVDVMTGELVWQAPWTRLVTADLYHLRFWENTERARQEAREDTEAYVRSSEPYAEETSTYEEPDEITVSEALPDLRETPIFTGQPQQVGFGWNLELVPERNPVHERLRVPVVQYAA